MAPAFMARLLLISLAHFQPAGVVPSESRFGLLDAGRDDFCVELKHCADTLKGLRESAHAVHPMKAKTAPGIRRMSHGPLGENSAPI